MCECCKQLEEKLAERDRQFEALRQELNLALQTINMMKHSMFGRSSEQMNPDQGKFDTLLNECDSINGNLPVSEPEKEKIEFERNKKGQNTNLNGREKIPDHIERVDKIIDLPESEKICPVTGLPMIKIGEEISEQMAYEPGRIYAIRYIRPKYVSPDRRNGNEVGVKTAPLSESPIERCKADVSLLTHIIISKYCDHLPLHRQAEIFQRNGIDLPKSSMCDWTRSAAEVLEPLYNLYRDTVLASDYLNADDTPIIFMNRKSGKTSQKGHMWGYLCRIKSAIGDGMNSPPENPSEHKLMFFDFTQNWDDEHPLKVLKDFKGFLQSDAYPGFKKIPEKLKNIQGIGCWAHSRRKFFSASKIGIKEAEYFVLLINILYRIEHRIAALNGKGFSDDYRLTLRQKRANRVMNIFFRKVKECGFRRLLDSDSENKWTGILELCGQ